MQHRTLKRSVFAFLALSAAGGCALILTASQPGRHPFVFAFGLSWFITTCVCAAYVSCQILFGLGPEPLGLARWERNGRIYEWCGVGIFRWILLHTHLHWLGPNLKLRSGRSDLRRLLREMHSAEAMHAIAAGAALAVAVGYALLRLTTVTTWLVVFTIPFHIYPVALQRWNRGRMLGLSERLGRQTAEQTRCSEPGEGAPVDNRRSVAPGH
jgi:hypothetical protein